MPWHMKQLIARGYWDEQGSEGGAGGGGSAPEDKGTEEGAQGNKGGAEPGAKKEGEDNKKGGVTDEVAKLVREVMEKKGTIKELTDKLKAWEGLDPSSVRKLVTEAQERETRRLEETGQWEALKKQMSEQNALQVKEKAEALEAKQQENAGLRKQIADLTVGNAFGNSRYIQDEVYYSPSKLRVVFGQHFEFDGEKVVGYNKPAGSKDRAPLVDASGNPLKFDAALAKLIEQDPDRDSILKSKIKQGAGSGTEKGVAAPERTTQLSGAARIAAALRKKS